MLITRNRSWLAAVADGVGRLLGLTDYDHVLPRWSPASSPQAQEREGFQSPHGSRHVADRTPDYGERQTEAGTRPPSVFVAVRRTY